MPPFGGGGLMQLVSYGAQDIYLFGEDVKRDKIETVQKCHCHCQTYSRTTKRGNTVVELVCSFGIRKSQLLNEWNDQSSKLYVLPRDMITYLIQSLDQAEQTQETVNVGKWYREN